jgi:hypothetical protein
LFWLTQSRTAAPPALRFVQHRRIDIAAASHPAQPVRSQDEGPGPGEGVVDERSRLRAVADEAFGERIGLLPGVHPFVAPAIGRADVLHRELLHQLRADQGRRLGTAVV